MGYDDFAASKGRAAEEKRIGADMIVHVKLDAGIEHHSKGVLIQSKRVERGASMSADDHADLVGQCKQNAGGDSRELRVRLHS